jgi:hypothetical protein
MQTTIEDELHASPLAYSRWDILGDLVNNVVDMRAALSGTDGVDKADLCIK